MIRASRDIRRYKWRFCCLAINSAVRYRQLAHPANDLCLSAAAAAAESDAACDLDLDDAR